MGEEDAGVVVREGGGGGKFVGVAVGVEDVEGEVGPGELFIFPVSEVFRRL